MRVRIKVSTFWGKVKVVERMFKCKKKGRGGGRACRKIGKRRKPGLNLVGFGKNQQVGIGHPSSSYNSSSIGRRLVALHIFCFLPFSNDVFM